MMVDEIKCSLHIFGAGRGESILLELFYNSENPDVFIIDTYSTKPVDSPLTNPIIAYQKISNFSWENVTGICLSHPHEDHFTGLAAVAERTVNAVWMRPTLTPLDSFVKHYDTIAKINGFKKSKHPVYQWVADSIRKIAEWGRTADDFCCIANRHFDLKNDDFEIQIIAPEDNIAADYARKLEDNIDYQLMDELVSSPKNLHNIASSGIVIDVKEGPRILLLGDMVEESWKSLLTPGNRTHRLLQEREAAIIKLPHHCSSGAIFEELLRITCNPNKTIAVFTPFSYKRLIPGADTINKVAPYVKELWGTVSPNNSINWKCKSTNGIFCDKVADLFIKNASILNKNPVDCRISVSIYNSGLVEITTGENAHSFK